MGLCYVYYDITQASNIPFFILILSIPVCYGLLHQYTFSCLLLLKIQKEGIKNFQLQTNYPELLIFCGRFYCLILNCSTYIQCHQGGILTYQIWTSAIKTQNPRKICALPQIERFIILPALSRIAKQEAFCLRLLFELSSSIKNHKQHGGCGVPRCCGRRSTVLKMRRNR